MNYLTSCLEWVMQGAALRREQEELDRKHFDEQLALNKKVEEWKKSKPRKP
jgi:hypothetical protein